ncbi:putative transmembrane protein [Toxoplasma gondii GAB2-2007-GAL-DOM2]|uniref:Transmembrane protein n=5 Tax=Toxoplasma gondii TaxID=5811 RepID=S7W960_TOXGG|nr:hypothetical protein TGGT1_248900 [Toxoplasma gondii GT1]KAF4638669.1 hypothetical protein TGRH88_062770 [Toxoplasma gondii]KFG46409.1 putative transmembrane protein [Toxoplasma gondii GAB2-2007-GAL-DOM2]KFG54168.1 putative transmembrane protein [Toxoplasma gondii FOU]RQX72180.1 putative transmembrane protein [Toxoplasma gondii CAST]
MPSDPPESPRAPVRSDDASRFGSLESVAPDLPFPDHSGLLASPTQAAKNETSDAAAAEAEQGGDSLTLAAAASTRDAQTNFPEQRETPNTPLWPGADEPPRVWLEESETTQEEGKEAKSRDTSRCVSPSLLSTLRDLAATLTPRLEDGERRHAHFSPDPIDPASSNAANGSQALIEPSDVPLSFPKDQVSSAANMPDSTASVSPADKHRKADKPKSQDQPANTVDLASSAEELAPVVKLTIPPLPLALPEASSGLRQRTETRESLTETPESAATVGTASTFLPAFASSSRSSVFSENAVDVHDGGHPSSAAALSQTPRGEAPPKGPRGRWHMCQLRSLLKRGRSRFMTRKNLWDYGEECMTNVWKLLQLSPGERGDVEIFGREGKEPIEYPLRLDKPAGETYEHEDEEEELEDTDSGRMTASPRRFANDKRERAYIRANHSLFERRFSGPYNLSMALMAAAATAAAFGALFLQVCFPLVFLTDAIPSFSTPFKGSFSDSLESPARISALAVLTWSAFLLLVACTVMLPHLCFRHISPHTFHRLSSLFPSFRPPPGPPASSSPPFFSFKAPFSLSPPPVELRATPAPATIHAADASPASSPPLSEALQDAEDALFASTFLRIYRRCMLGDISGAEALAEEAVALSDSQAWREECMHVGGKNEENGLKESNGEKGESRAREAPLSPRALSRALEENKKLEAIQESRRRASETRKAIMCSITEVTLHPSAVSIPSKEEEEEKRNLVPLLDYEAAVRRHICRGACLLGGMALGCVFARLLLLVCLKGSSLDSDRSPAAGEAVVSRFPFLESGTVRLSAVSAEPAFSLPVALTAYARWLSLEVVSLLAVLQFVTAALVLRPREDAGILQRLLAIACSLLVFLGVAELALVDSGIAGVPTGFWIVAKVPELLAVTLSVGLRVFLLCVALVAARVSELHERQLFFGRTPRLSSSLSTLPLPSSSVPPSPGVLCATSRTAAAAATILALAAKRRSS